VTATIQTVYLLAVAVACLCVAIVGHLGACHRQHVLRRRRKLADQLRADAHAERTVRSPWRAGETDRDRDLLADLDAEMRDHLNRSDHG